MDTGQFTLNATLDTAATSLAPALSLTGSAAVTAVPVGYGVAAATIAAPAATQTACAGVPSAACDASAGVSARVGSAGSVFSSTVTAALWSASGNTNLAQNPVAPSYAGVVNLAPVLAAPLGGQGGALAVTSVTLAAGTVTTASQAWTQSGALKIAAAGTYFSQAVSGQSLVLGRFSPRNFNTIVTAHGCGAPPNAYTYSGQPITIVKVQAMDGATPSAVTPNYTGAFARSVLLSDSAALPIPSGSFSVLASTIATASFGANGATAAPVYTFNTKQTAPTTVVIRADDGEISSSGFTEGSSQILGGRLHMLNAFGSELLPLKIPIEAQYWTGQVFARNAIDNCTTLAVPTAITLAGAGTPNGAANLNFYPVVVAGKNQLAANQTAVTLASSQLAGGVDQLLFTAPGALHSGWVDVVLAVPNYLLADWGNCSGQVGAAGLFDDLPCARASFGLFRSPLIYRRENY
jgi:MSHA biogenesis protein MshQ